MAVGGGQHQRAGAEDHQDGHGSEHFAADDPGACRRQQGRQHDPGGPAVGQAHDAGLARVRGLDEADHALQGAVLADLDGAHVERAELVDRAAADLVAGALVHRQGFAGHDRLVDGRLAIEDDAVHGDGLAGQHAQRIARPHGLGRDDAFRTAFRQTARRARGEMHQPLDAGPCPRHGALFQQRAQLHDEGDFARSKDLADNDRRHQRQRHQHVRADVETGEEALRPFAEDGHAAKQDRQPGRVQPADAHIAKTQYQRQRGRAQRCRLPGFLSQPLPYLCEHDASMKK